MLKYGISELLKKGSGSLDMPAPAQQLTPVSKPSGTRAPWRNPCSSGTPVNTVKTASGTPVGKIQASTPVRHTGPGNAVKQSTMITPPKLSKTTRPGASVQHASCQIPPAPAQDSGSKMLLRMSALQIKADNVFDLLQNGSEKLQVREDINSGAYVDGLSEQTVYSGEHCMSLNNILQIIQQACS